MREELIDPSDGVLGDDAALTSWVIAARLEVDRVRLDEKEMQFLFMENGQATFMDNDTYEQIAIPRETIGEPADFLRDHCDAHLHAGGICRMGSSEDPRSVVDPECRVIGVSGLRVIDASIMPYLPRATTHLTTVMIAEHMAERLARSD